VPVDDHAFRQHDELISAAHAAVSWARARRATWTSEPLTVVGPPPAPVEAILPPAILPSVSHTVADAVSRPVASPSRSLAPSPTVLRWLARGAIAAALVTAVVIGGRYLWTSLPTVSVLRTASVEPKPAGAVARKPAGSLRVGSTPAGARVIVDGKPRGVTPLALADVSIGRHEVTLQSDAGSVKRTVTVAANATVTIEEAIFSGFVTIYAPFDVTISEGGRVLRADDRHQVMLSPGAHELRVTNLALGYEAIRRVDVKPGEATNVQLTPDPSVLTVTAAEPADVWLDGTRLGETPLNAAPVPLGIHDIVVKRADGGERRFTVTIGTKPYNLAVDFQAR
jgi:PEGA domain-containing protein